MYACRVNVVGRLVLIVNTWVAFPLLLINRIIFLSYLYSRLEGGGARDRGIGLKTQLAGFISDLLVPCSLQLK